MKESIFLSVIVPVFNEQDRIENIKIIQKYLQKQKYTSELLVVDDGSKDSTLRKLTSINSKSAKKLTIITLDKNMGKGFAIKTGMLAAEGQLRIFMDVDLSVDMHALQEFIAQAKDADICISSRRLPGSKILLQQQGLRETMGRIFTWISQVGTGVNVTDFTCGCKCFSKKAAIKIFTTSAINRWGFDSEILFLAKKYEYRIKEIPVYWKNDPRSKVKFPQDIFSSVKELLEIRINDFLRSYD